MNPVRGRANKHVCFLITSRLLSNHFPIMSLDPKQTFILQWIIKNTKKAVWVTGGAGTGKSFLLRAVLRAFETHTVRGVSVTAPTGIAAVNVSGMTLHKFLGIQMGFENMTTERVFEYAAAFVKDPKYSNKCKKIRSVNILVIDEISMVHAKMYKNMDTLLRAIRGRPRDPFGGVRLFMVGDFLQLPPVPDKKDKPSDPLFVFETENWKTLDPQIFVLEHSFRQENDELFFEVLNEIRWGVVSEKTKKALRACVRTLPADHTGPQMTLMPRNDSVDRINKMHIDAINEPLKVYTANDFGPDHLLKDIRALPRIELKKGAQVMLLKNITIKRPRVLDPMEEDEDDAPPEVDILPNGAIGRVSGFEGESDMNPGSPQVDFPTIGNIEAHTRTLGVAMFDIVETMGEKPVASRMQLPLVASYAMSIHKAQGQTITCPIVTATSRIFGPGMFYVLLSRAQRLDQLYLDDLDLTKITTHPRAVAFMRALETKNPVMVMPEPVPPVGQKRKLNDDGPDDHLAKKRRVGEEEAV